MAKLYREHVLKERSRARNGPAQRHRPGAPRAGEKKEEVGSFGD